MASGVEIADACVDIFNDIKLKKTHRYAIFGFNDAKDVIEVKAKVDKGTTEEDSDDRNKHYRSDYEDFCTALVDWSDKKKEGCYAVYDFVYYRDDGSKREKVIFISWAPDSLGIKPKMLTASSKDRFKRKLVGVALHVEGNDLDEVTWDAVCDKLNSLKSA